MLVNIYCNSIGEGIRRCSRYIEAGLKVDGDIVSIVVAALMWNIINVLLNDRRSVGKQCTDHERKPLTLQVTAINFYLLGASL